MFILLSMTSCRWFEEEEEIRYDRTVLVYMAADNNLVSFQKEDIEEMTQGAGDIPRNCRLIIYVDDTDLPRILSVEQQEGRRPVCKTLHQYDTEHDSGNSETLHIAMDWVVEHSPSESYGLVLWSHGDAWIPDRAPAQKVVCLDSNSGSWMEIADIADVLSEFPQLEFILFDACFMQSIEVAYELRHTANYIIGSPAEIPAPGAPYDRIVEAMFSPINSAVNIAEEYYQVYNEGKVTVKGIESESYGVCLSVVDCNQLEQLATATQEMIAKYANSQNDAILQGVQRYFLRNWSTRPEYYDMNGYMRCLITDNEDYELWRSTFDKAIPYKKATPHWYSDYTGMEYINDMESYSGISCYVPQHSSSHNNLNKLFQSTSWYHAAGWGQAGW